MLDGPLASQSLLMWMNGVIAFVWFVCAVNAFTKWRSFGQSVDLRWMAGFTLMGLFAVGEALSARGWLTAAAVEALDPMTIGSAADMGSFDVNFAVMHFIASLLMLLTFRGRRVRLD